MGIFQSAKCLYFAGIGQMLFRKVSQKMYCLDTIFTECPHYKLQATKSNLFISESTVKHFHVGRLVNDADLCM